MMIVAVMPAYAVSSDSPLEQYQSGIPIDMIQCNDGKLLMVTSADKPVCVTSNSAMQLADRDYATVCPPETSQKDDVKNVTISNNNDNTSTDDDAVAMNDGSTTMMQATDDTGTGTTMMQATDDAGTGTTMMQATDDTSIAATNNKFAIDFYRQISGTPKNIFFSPVSMYLAFSILYEGARESTAQEMQDVFGFEPDRDARHNSVSHFISSINRDDPHIELNTANALWIADWFKPYDSYTSVARETYHSTAEKVNFLDPGDGVKKITSGPQITQTARLTK